MSTNLCRYYICRTNSQLERGEAEKTKHLQVLCRIYIPPNFHDKDLTMFIRISLQHKVLPCPAETEILVTELFDLPSYTEIIKSCNTKSLVCFESPHTCNMTSQ